MIFMASKRGAYLDAHTDKRAAWAQIGALNDRLQRYGLDNLFEVRARRGDASYILELVQYKYGPISAEQVSALQRMAHSGRDYHRR